MKAARAVATATAAAAAAALNMFYVKKFLKIVTQNKQTIRIFSKQEELFFLSRKNQNIFLVHLQLIIVLINYFHPIEDIIKGLFMVDVVVLLIEEIIEIIIHINNNIDHKIRKKVIKSTFVIDFYFLLA